MKRSRLSWAAVVTTAVAAMLTSTAPAQASTGSSVYFNVRYTDGSWMGYEKLIQPPGGCCQAISTAMDGSPATHVDVVTSSGLWDESVDSGNNQSGWAQPPQPPGTFSTSRNVPFAEVSDDAGGIWLFVVTSSGLYAGFRNPSGSWNSWKSVSLPSGVSPSGVSDLALAYTQVGLNGTSPNLQVMVDNNGILWHQVYSFNTGTWSGWAQPKQVPGDAEAIAAAGDASGNVQFIATNYNGTVYHNIRYTNGTWQGWVAPHQPSYPSPAGTIPLPGGAAAAVDGGGIAQFTLNASKFFHIVRNADGSWQSSWASPPGTIPASCLGYYRLAVTARETVQGFPFYFATYC